MTARTAKTITISDGEKVQKCRIIKAASEYRNAELCKAKEEFRTAEEQLA